MFVLSVATSTAPPGLATRFARILGGLGAAIAVIAAKNPAARPLLVLLHGRLSRAVGRFARLVALASQGRLPRPRIRPRQPAKPPPAPKPALPARPRLPQARYWLIRLVGSEACCYASQLRHLMQDPEMAALLEAAPQAARILRPLCRVLAIKPLPAILAPPPHDPTPRTRQTKPSAAAHPARPDPATAPRRNGPPSVEEICVLAGIPPPLQA